MKDIRSQNVVEALCIALVVALLALVVFRVGDSASLPERTANTYVTSKHHTSGYTTFIYVNKTLIPEYRPPVWEVCVQIEQQQPCDDVGEIRYDQINVGDHVAVAYGVGRWSGKYYLETVIPIS